MGDKQERCIFFAVLSASFIMPFMASAINVAIPSMAVEFGMEAASLSWVVTAFLLGSASALLPFGRLADMVGRKRLFRTGILLVFFVTAGCGMAKSVGFLVLLRFFQGIAMAMIFSTGMAILVESRAPSERGRVLGYSTAAVYSGLTFGPFLGGAITQYLGWRMIFFFTVAILAGSWYMARQMEDKRRCAGEQRFDYAGSVLYFFGSLSVLYGLSSYEKNEAAPWLVAGGCLLFALFLLEQRFAGSPLLDLAFFRNVTFSMSNLAALLHYSSTFAISFLLSLYLQLVRGLDEMSAGLVLLLQPVVMALFSPSAGKISDRFQARLVASFGMAMTSLGIFLLSSLEKDTPFSLVGGALLVVGIGFAFFSSPNSNAIMGSVRSDQLGVASSFMAIMRIFGQAISMAVVTLLLQGYVVSGGGMEDYLASLLQGIHGILRLFAGICCVGVAVSLMRGK